MIDAIRLIFRFCILVLAQVVVLNNMRLGGYINPYLYILFIMLLPVRIPKTLLLFVSFALGLCVDMFSNTMGLHAAASVFLGFVRPGILRIMSPRDGYEAEAVPTIRQLGLQWFFIYTLLCVLAHHFVLFYLEVFRMTEFFSTFLRVILSSIMTIVFILISQFLFGKTGVKK
jgi:rod shape-determining protein MreD